MGLVNIFIPAILFRTLYSEVLIETFTWTFSVLIKFSSYTSGSQPGVRGQDDLK